MLHWHEEQAHTKTQRPKTNSYVFPGIHSINSNKTQTFNKRSDDADTDGGGDGDGDWDWDGGRHTAQRSADKSQHEDQDEDAADDEEAKDGGDGDGDEVDKVADSHKINPKGAEGISNKNETCRERAALFKESGEEREGVGRAGSDADAAVRQQELCNNCL